MATATKAAKKAVSKSRAKVSKVYYVLSKRAKLFGWNPVQVFPTYELAATYMHLYEKFNIYGVNGYKITKVTLVTDKPDDHEIITLP